MLKELKRCNSVGNINDLIFLISIIAGKEKISRDEIHNRCILENDISFNYPGAISFLEYLCLVEEDMEFVKSTDSLDFLSKANNNDKIKKLVTLAINKLVEEGIFDSNMMSFDSEKGHLTIKRSAFPLTYAAIRNFLITVGALEKEENGEICVGANYEGIWFAELQSRRKKITLDCLLKQQEEQSRRGLEAEEFVLQLEKNRIPRKACQIKRISDFDVSAGYDIVSYEEETSEQYDRFIEVKCYLGSERFFWSENESDVAKIKEKKYVLCLVDYERIGELGYIPEFILNPYKVIFESNQWMVNPASYRIQKI